jgi:hypothetical protein
VQWIKAGFCHLFLLQWLTQHFQPAAVMLRQLIEEEHAMMRQADLAGRRRAAAADHAGIADGVMRRAKRTPLEQRLIGRQPPQGAVDTGRLQALHGSQRRQDGRQPLRQHRLAGARTADHQHNVTAGCHHQGTLGQHGHRALEKTGRCLQRRKLAA